MGEGYPARSRARIFSGSLVHSVTGRGKPERAAVLDRWSAANVCFY